MNCELVPAVVLGNGPSRKTVKLEDLKKENVVYGCNALYRDWEPDYLVANDWRMMLEIIAAGYKGACVFCDFNPLPAETFDSVLDGMLSEGEGPGESLENIPEHHQYNLPSGHYEVEELFRKNWLIEKKLLEYCGQR